MNFYSARLTSNPFRKSTDKKIMLIIAKKNTLHLLQGVLKKSVLPLMAKREIWSHR